MLAAIPVVLMVAVASLTVSAAPASLLSVHGRHLVEQAVNTTSWQPAVRHGVTGSGALFMCVNNYAIFDGPTSPAYMAAMHTWRIGIIRVPMNEDCWLGINGVLPAYGGPVYQKAFKAYIDALVESGFNVILELHWTSANGERALKQQQMPDKNHSVPFWTGVAETFGNNRAVIFDLFNEPFPLNNTWDSVEAWTCWRDGGAACKLHYEAAGMQLLVSTVRAAGAQNVLMLGGINYSNSLTQWVQFKPHDPLERLAASWHSYNFNYCIDESCWNASVAPTMETVPVIAGEIGENDCLGTYITPLMRWLDTRNTSYLAWLWADWSCDKGPALITHYNGSCTESYGCTYRDHLLSFA
jgi:endoglucanase